MKKICQIIRLKSAFQIQKQIASEHDKSVNKITIHATINDICLTTGGLHFKPQSL
jgi:hypothetical protein